MQPLVRLSDRRAKSAEGISAVSRPSGAGSGTRAPFAACSSASNASPEPRGTDRRSHLDATSSACLTAMRLWDTASVRYQRRDTPRSGRPLFLDRDISLYFRFSHGPRAREPSANRRCLSRCGEPSSDVKIRRCSPRDRVLPQRPRTSTDCSIAARSLDDRPKRRRRETNNRYVFCPTI
jgi:hypothetical protein